MIRYITLFFGYCLSLKLTSSTIWAKDLAKKFTRSRKEKAQSNIHRFSSSSVVKKKHLRSILRLWDTEPLQNEAKLKLSGQNNNLFSGGLCFLVVVAASIALSIKPYNAADILIWQCLALLFLFFVWSNLKSCTEFPFYIFCCIAREKLIRAFPFRSLSRTCGKLCDVTVPLRLRSCLFSSFIKVYGVKLEEATEQDLTQYHSLNSFFRRSIQAKFRPIDHHSQVVSPSDGTVVFHGPVVDGMVQQVKGMCYSVKHFFGESAHTKNGPQQCEATYAEGLLSDRVTNQMFACVIYLAPGDYHRFHSPAEWNLLRRRHITGELNSVRPRLLEWLPHLFAINERVVLSGEWKHGFFSMSAVGATNVGSIVVYADRELGTNSVYDAVPTTHDFHYDETKFLSKGDSVGEFRFGSTIVLLYEAPRTTKLTVHRRQVVKYGQSIAR